MTARLHPARYRRSNLAAPSGQALRRHVCSAQGMVHNIAVLQPVSTQLPAASAAGLAAPVQSPASDGYLVQCIQLIAQHAMASSLNDTNAATDTRAGAEQAFSVLYDHTVKRVHALVRRYVKDESTAQEITEDVFFMAWSQAPRFNAARGNPIAWLLIMARSKALDAWRQHAARLVHFDSDATDDLLAQASAHGTPLDLLETVDQKNALHHALAQVSPAARQMLSLAFFQGLTHSEISGHLKTPLGTVKTTLRRALLSMREILQTQCGAELPAGLLEE